MHPPHGQVDGAKFEILSLQELPCDTPAPTAPPVPRKQIQQRACHPEFCRASCLKAVCARSRTLREFDSGQNDRTLEKARNSAASNCCNFITNRSILARTLMGLLNSGAPQVAAERKNNSLKKCDRNSSFSQKLKYTPSNATRPSAQRRSGRQLLQHILTIIRASPWNTELDSSLQSNT